MSTCLNKQVTCLADLSGYIADKILILNGFIFIQEYLWGYVMKGFPYRLRPAFVQNRTVREPFELILLQHHIMKAFSCKIGLVAVQACTTREPIAPTRLQHHMWKIVIPS